MAYWLHCQFCKQWSKFATGLSEDKSCPFCDSFFVKTKPYPVPKKVIDETTNIDEMPQNGAIQKQVQAPELKKMKTFAGESEVETTAIAIGTPLLQEEVERKEVLETPPATNPRFEKTERQEVPQLSEKELIGEVMEAPEEAEKLSAIEPDATIQNDNQLEQEAADSAPVRIASNSEWVSGQDVEEALLKTDEQILEWERENGKYVSEEELEIDYDLSTEVPNGDSENQDLHKTEQSANAPEQSGIQINFKYEKSESIEKSKESDVSGVTDHVGDMPVAAENSGQEKYERHEMPEENGEVIDWVLEEDNEVNQEELIEDEDLKSDTDQIQNEPMMQGKDGGLKLDKPEVLDSLQQLKFVDIIEPNGDCQIVLETRQSGKFEMLELSEYDSEVINEELEEDEGIRKEELEEDVDLTCETHSKGPETVEESEFAVEESPQQPETEGLNNSVESNKGLEISPAAEAPEPEFTDMIILPDEKDGKMKITITYDFSQKSIDHIDNLAQEVPENTETAEIVDEAALNELEMVEEAEEATEAGESAQANDDISQTGAEQEAAGLLEKLERNFLEEMDEDLERPKMTRIHERYIEMKRRISKQPQL
ncbi:MAG: hypothetical protein ABRQ26_03090 [Syntrophomonadaceae bacterium]